MSALEHLAGTMVLGALLEEVRKRYGAFDLLAHWKQGEFGTRAEGSTILASTLERGVPWSSGAPAPKVPAAEG